MAEYKIRKCPRCGSDADYYEEFWKNLVIIFSIEDGELDIEGILNPGYPYKVKATCSNNECGHKWTLRGVTQITNLEK